MSITIKASWEGQKPLEHFDALKVLTEWADDVGPKVRDALKARTPVVTGRMRQSERYARSGFAAGVRLEFRAHTTYAQYVIYGARAHLIEAKAARSLRWYGGKFGPGVHFAKVVHHPGNQPNRFPEEVLDAMKDELMTNLKQRVDEALRKGN